MVKKNNNVQCKKYHFRVYDFNCLTVKDFNFLACPLKVFNELSFEDPNRKFRNRVTAL